MSVVRNKTQAPVKIPLGRDRVLHLGPGHAGRVSREATLRPAFRKLVEAGTIAVEGEAEGAELHADGPQKTQESTQGHPQPRVVLPKGNR